MLEQWAEDAEDNPLSEVSRELEWPVDPLGGRRSAVNEGARLVLEALEALENTEDAGADTENTDEEIDDPDGWVSDTDVLLAERARAREPEAEIDLPATLSVSQLVDLAGQPEDLARRLRRPLPFPPNAHARRGTEFHGWLERRFSGDKLFDLDDLPGAADPDGLFDGLGGAHDADDHADDTAHLEALKEAFERSEWARRTPHDVEVPFSTDVDGITVRGRMDAVFADPDGGWTVVDWKTGALPDAERLPTLSVQLAAYRLAWAALSGTPLERVRAAFHYVRPNRTVRPVDLLDADGLRALLRTVPERREQGEAT